MDYYDVVFTTELLEDAVFEDVVRQVIKRHGPQGCDLTSERRKNRFISTIKPVQDTKPLNEDHCSVWTELPSENGIIEHVIWKVAVCEQGTERPSDSLVEWLHKLTDHLPPLGCLVGLTWLFSDETLPDVPENIELFGALKRLLAWQNADFRFLHLDQEVKVTEEVQDMAEPWVTILRGHVCNKLDLVKPEACLLWRGCIAVGNANTEKLVQLPGFELRSRTSDPEMNLEDILDKIIIPDIKPKKSKSGSDKYQGYYSPRLLSTRMEFVAQVDIQEIPLLYFTGLCCHLCLPSGSRLVDRSLDFINQLQENKRLCYIVRLNHGTSWRVPDNDKLYKDKERREHKSWQDLVQDNVENIFNNPCLPELDGNLGQDFFLLYNDDHSLDGASCTAHLLRRCDQFSGDLVHRSVMATLHSQHHANGQFGQSECSYTDIEGLLNSLPCVTGEAVVDLQTKVGQAQLKAIQEWTEVQQSSDKTTGITITHLMDLLRTVKTDIQHHLEDNCIPQVSPPSIEGSDCALNGPNLPISHLERFVLDYQSKSESGFSRYKSNESLAGLSPPTKGKVLTLNAAEFLKFFKADGSSIKENLEEVQFKKTRGQKLMKFDSGEMKSAPWPECGSYHYHGIYYNQTEREQMEVQSQRLKSRLQRTETSSTCTISQVRSPATITVSTNPGDDLQPTPDHSKVTPEKVTPEIITSERITRGAAKRKAEGQALQEQSKLKEKKPRSVSKIDQRSKETQKPLEKDTGSQKLSEDDKKQESRSQRHKRKLEDVVKHTLKDHGVNKDNPLFKPCALRLYNITKSFVKDLTTYQSLRQEMERIAQSNVKMIVDFEKERQARTNST